MTISLWQGNYKQKKFHFSPIKPTDFSKVTNQQDFLRKTPMEAQLRARALDTWVPIPGLPQLCDLG